MTNQLPKMTDRDTKATILGAYEKALTKIKELESGKMNPTALLEAKEVAAVVEAAEGVTAEGTVEGKITNLKKQMNGVLDELSNSITDQLDTYNKVKKAIEIQESKLKELFDIESEAFALVALVNSKEELLTEYDAQMYAKKAEAQDELNDIIRAGQEQRQVILKQTHEQRVELEKERQREKENYEYNFNREKREKEDKLNDELNAKRKQFAAEVEEANTQLGEKSEALKKRQAELEVREDKIEELEATIDHLKENTEKAVAQAKAITANQLKAEFEREKEYLAKDAKHVESVLQSKVEMLSGNLEGAAAKIRELDSKLEKAYSEIRELANKTVDNAGDKKVVSQLERIISNQSNKQ